MAEPAWIHHLIRNEKHQAFMTFDGVTIFGYAPTKEEAIQNLKERIQDIAENDEGVWSHDGVARSRARCMLQLLRGLDNA